MNKATGFSMRRLTRQQLVQRRWRLAAAWLLTSLAVGFAFSEYGLHHPADIPPFPVPVDARSLTNFVAQMILVGAEIAGLAFVIPLIETREISSRAQRDLAEMCDAHTSLQHYRNLVMASGRGVTWGELDRMRRWLWHQDRLDASEGEIAG
ncbi:hypothetical protein AB4Y45_33440 [Paraburkholderia sp. EG287A]|uniref:hypothetical protein n=1 Tax=Paraburkholderia sp. EG287A TaxID=3237012 RepID=UPI0034D35663